MPEAVLTVLLIQPHDYFSSLPPELLIWIFDIAYQWGAPDSFGPLSKRLLPYYYQARFQTITVHLTSRSGHHWDRPRLKMSPQAASLVRTLRLEAGSQGNGWVPHSHGLHGLLSSSPPFRALKVPARAADAVQAILASESHYRDVGVERSPTPPIDWSCLTHLTIHTGRRRKCKTASVSHFSPDASLFSLSCLTDLPSVNFLHLKEWYSPTRDKEPTVYPDFALPSIKTLIIEGVDSTEPSIVSDVLDHCPSLLHLDICGSTSGHRSPEEQRRRIRPLFRNLVRLPSGLKTLRLASGHWRLITDRHPVDLKDYAESFAHLHQLERLHLGITCFNFR